MLAATNLVGGAAEISLVATSVCVTLAGGAVVVAAETTVEALQYDNEYGSVRNYNAKTHSSVGSTVTSSSWMTASSSCASAGGTFHTGGLLGFLEGMN